MDAKNRNFFRKVLVYNKKYIKKVKDFQNVQLSTFGHFFPYIKKY